MKTIVVRQPGGPENLVVENVVEPSPGSGELLVDVAAAGVNFIDTYHRTGLYPLDFPFVPGLEGAGKVIKVGTDVSDISVGDRVGWVNVLGSYSERLRLPVEKAIPLPDDIKTKVAAAVFLQGITAHYLSTDTCKVGKGDKCLIHAGAGGVGLLLTQIARMKGAYVITTVGSQEKAELSRAAGADEVINYNQTDFKDAVEELIGPNQLNVVYDGVGATTFAGGIDLLSPRGMMVTFGNASGPVPEISPLMLAGKGSIFLTRPTMAHYIQNRSELLSRTDDLFGWIAAGDLNVRVGAEYPLENAAEAHRALEGRQTVGKVILCP